MTVTFGCCCAPPLVFLLPVLVLFLLFGASLILVAAAVLGSIGRALLPARPLDEPRLGTGA